MLNDNLCNERHDGINRSLVRIENKVDTLIWKLLGAVIALVGLLLAGLKLVA
jgi:hypothetical protein